MDVYPRDRRFPPPADRPVVATLGNFDGLHRGHRAIMERVVERARAVRGCAVVLTFDPHPLTVLTHDRAPRMILSRDQKHGLLEAWGLDAVVELPFDHAMANLAPDEFAAEVLAQQIGVKELYVGADFRFGRRPIGNEVGKQKDYTSYIA